MISLPIMTSANGFSVPSFIVGVEGLVQLLGVLVDRHASASAIV
jgi:hypothetical protein